jgi:erythromycin esterase
MKNNCVLLLILLCGCFTNHLAAQEVVNGGFELVAQNGVARNWITDDAQGKFSISHSDKVFRSGSQSLVVSGTQKALTASDAGIAANLFGSISSTRVTAIQLSGWIRSDAALDSAVSLFIQNGSNIIRSQTVQSHHQGWYRFILDYQIPSSQTWYQFYYGIELRSNHKVWLDDLSLTVNGLSITDPETLYQEPSAESLKWLSRNLSPIQATAVGQPEQDLSAIATAVQHARIIAVGEPTHGSSEATKFKTRLLAYLVKHKGITAIALEESIPTCDQMNRLLNTNTPALKDSLLRMPFYKLWKTQEMLELLSWIQEYNLSHQTKVQFIGIDMEDLGLKNSRSGLRDYGLKHNQKIYLQTLMIDKNLDSLLKLSRMSMDGDKTMAAANGIKQDIDDLDSLIILDGKNIANALTSFELRSYVRVCRQWIDSKFFLVNRDEYLADNINSYLNANPEAKIFVWAHNFHIANANIGGQRTMGKFLKEKYAAQYYPLSITTSAGTYMAAENNALKKWHSYKIEPAYKGTYEYVFAKMKVGQYFLNLKLEDKASGAAWLNLPMKQLDLGYIYAGEEHYEYIGTLKKSFDGLIYIDHTTASKSLIE